MDTLKLLQGLNPKTTVLLIDIENFKEPVKAIKKIKEAVGKDLCMQIAYTNWTASNNDLKIEITNNAITPKQVITYGGKESNFKNASDIALALDAFEMIYTKPHIETFIIASGDGGFMQLTTKLREHGKDVYGIAIEEQCSEMLKNHCTGFYTFSLEVERVVKEDKYIEIEFLPAVTSMELETPQENTSTKRIENLPQEREMSLEEFLVHRFSSKEHSPTRKIKYAIMSKHNPLIDAINVDGIEVSVIKEVFDRYEPDFFYFNQKINEFVEAHNYFELKMDKKRGLLIYNPAYTSLEDQMFKDALDDTTFSQLGNLKIEKKCKK